MRIETSSPETGSASRAGGPDATPPRDASGARRGRRQPRNKTEVFGKTRGKTAANPRGADRKQTASGAAVPRFARALRRSTDRAPGYTRRLVGGRFAYFDADGARIREPVTIARIDALAIPPAYTDVWICADDCGHLQATGRDARGRKQYRYHPRWRDERDRDKFAKLADFARALPRIRARVAADLRRRGLPRDKVVAAIVRLLDSTLVRIGNAEYVRENASYGLTTLRKHHLRDDGRALKLCFNGKHGIGHEIVVAESDVVRVIRRCAALPGRQLFRHDDGRGTHKITAADVNAWLHEAGGDAFTAKDYRTWAASAAALARLRACEPPRNARAARSALARVARDVAALLRNTPAVCRNSYIHPAVVEAFAAGELPALRCRVRRAGLGTDERLLATLLEACPPR